jgi:hypothetical protein
MKITDSLETDDGGLRCRGFPHMKHPSLRRATESHRSVLKSRPAIPRAVSAGADRRNVMKQITPVLKDYEISG